MCLMEIKEEIKDESEWMITINNDLQQLDALRAAEMQHWDKHSIYKVPISTMGLNQKAYKPTLVSFGPYHHGDFVLMPMEEHKRRALLHFIKKSSKSLESHLESLAEVAQSLIDSYESLDLLWKTNTDRFLRMMLVDGCFMIEIMRHFTTPSTSTNYASNDLVFSRHGMLHVLPYIKLDMLMLENQIPMLLLTTLLDEETKRDKEFVNNLICEFLGFFNARRSIGECSHFLDVHRKTILWQDRRTCIRPTRMPAYNVVGGTAAGDEIILSAVNITEAGISLKKSKSKSLQDISFDRRAGELRLPTIIVDDTTESMFLNHMAFERFHVGTGNQVTSYLAFISSIINTAEDVSLLRDKGIIHENFLRSDKAVSNLFNSISRGTVVDQDSDLVEVLMMVDNYCRQPLNKCWAYACRNYYATFSAAAAFIIFILSMLQTVYSMLSYYQHK